MRIKPPGFRIGAANAVSFSRSGRFLAQVGRRVVIYDVGTRSPITRSEWHYPHPAAATFGGSDDWVAIRSTTGAIAVLDLPTGEPRSRLPPPADVADDSNILTGPTGEHVVEATTGGILRVRRTSDLGIDYAEEHPQDMLGALTSDAEHQRWAIAFNRKQLDAPRQPPCRIELRSWPLSGEHRQVLGDQFGYVYALALSPDGTRLLVLERTPSRELALSLLSTSTGVVEHRATNTEWGTHRGLAWAPNGDWLVIGTDQGHALLAGRSFERVGHLDGEYSSDAAFTADGRLLALGYWGSGVVIPGTDLRQWFGERDPSASKRAV